MMGNKVIEQIVNPFIRIAGMKALGWGVLGLAVSTWICWISGYHYHGLLHFGPAPNPAWWCYLAEHLILSLLGLPFLIVMLVWMFNALKVSCNLKSWQLWTVALVGIIGGDVLCRIVIGWLY